MPYQIEKTIKLYSRLGSIVLSVDGSVLVSWDMLNELGGSVESRSRTIAAADVPAGMSVAQIFEWADAKIVLEETAHQEAEAAAIAAKNP